MKVINLFAGPGAGKSTCAAGLFFLMKSRGLKVELVTEFAKDLVWADRQRELEDQLYIVAKQNHRLFSLRRKVDYVITDSPILLTLVYQTDMPASFDPFVLDTFHSYDNHNFFIDRCKPYHPYGRVQTEEEAHQVDLRIAALLRIYGLRYRAVKGNSEAPDTIFEHLTKEGAIR